MCQQVQSVTLQTAVLLTAKEFAQNSQTFSVHDITRAIRSKTANGDLEIPEVEVSGASFRFDIPHSKVKAIFLEMWNTGVFDPDFTLSRQFNSNGGYFEYTPALVGGTTVQVSTPAPVTQTATATATAPVSTAVSSGKPSRSEVSARVEQYLQNCAGKNFRPTLKQVQSAIKRGDVSTGWSCAELQDVIENDLSYSVVADPDAVSASQVAVV